MTKSSTQEAIFASIEKQVETLNNAQGLFPSDRATILCRLALAYRYAAGGPQPGSIEVEVGE